MTIQPLPKLLHQKLIAAEIKQFVVELSGGSDQGNLQIGIYPYIPELRDELYEWAYDHYPYNGAGDGTDYGDDIEYDLINNTVSHTEWTTERTDTYQGSVELDVL